MTNMNILVTGGYGQLGRCLDKISAEYPDFNFLFTDLPEADITDCSAMERLICAGRIDTIINCAAYTDSNKAETEGVKVSVLANIKGPAVLADIAARVGCKLVHISTDYVFGNDSHIPLKETDKTNPLGVYGITKLAGEKMVLSSDADVVVVRTSWLYSEFGSNFMKTMLRLSQTRDSVRVVADQTGSPTYGVDLARVILELLRRGISGRELYHFSNSGEVSWCGFAQEIIRQAGRDVEVVPITSAEYGSDVCRPEYSVLDTSKIRSEGIHVTEWKEALSRCLMAVKELESV